MKSWENERPIYETELTPQQKEAEKEAAKERMEKEYERGRKTIFAMMSLYVSMSILGVLINVFLIADIGQGTGYLLFALPDIALALLLAYKLYNGKQWARIIFAILLGLSILTLLGNLSRLNIGRTDYSSKSGDITLVYSDGQLVESWKLGEEELADLQNQEDLRAKVHRIVMVVGLIFLVVQVSYFYLLFFYHPVKEFLYAQETKDYWHP